MSGLEKERKKKHKICCRVFKSLINPQNRSFHVVNETRTGTKCTKMEKRMRNANKNYCCLLLNVQICNVFVAVVFVFA